MLTTESYLDISDVLSYDIYVHFVNTEFRSFSYMKIRRAMILFFCKAAFKK